MKNKLIKILKSKECLSFSLCLLLGFLVIFPSILLSGKWIYTIIDDFNLQQLPFNILMNKEIKSGNIFWTWFNDLGSNFIATFSFYNLLSPFNIIGYLFPPNWYPYIVGPLEILKYGISGLTAFLFLKRYVKNKNYAVMGALLYSFSGFQLTTLLYHFHDVIALFPLLLYGLDKLVYDNKKGVFCSCVVLLSVTNWFFLIGEVVFVAIYFFIKVIMKEYKITKSIFKNIVIESILGVLISAFIILPSLLFTSENPRVSSEWTLLGMFKYNITSYIEIIKALIMPSEVMFPRPFITNINYSSVDFYLPFVGVILVITYLLRKPKNWQTILVIVSIIFMFIPILNSSFFAFRSTYYARWFYMPILIFSLVSVKAIEEKCDINKGIIGTILLYLIMIIIIKHSIGFDNVIFNKNYFINSIIVVLLSIILIYLIHNMKNEQYKIILYILCIMGYVSIWGNYTLMKYRSAYGEDNWKISQKYKNYYEYDDSITRNAVTRINTNKCYYNLGMINNSKDIASFNSNINGSAFKFYNSIGMDRSISTIVDVKNKKLNDLLAVQYIVSCNNDDDLEKYGYKFVKNIKNYKLYENKEYKNYGFAVNKYISKRDFKKLSNKEKIKQLTDHIVLDEKQIKKYSNIYEKETNTEYTNYSFKLTINGFESKINTTNETLAIYTIPYDKGWTATVNGKKVKIEDVDNGLIGIKINKGNNKIVVKYVPPGFIAGLIISCFSIIILIIYLKK